MNESKKILIIDDDPNTGRMVQFALEIAGYTVSFFLSGREGLRYLYTHRPHLVILDLMMPDMDGWEICRQIRLLSNIPIILLTALDGNQEMVRGLNLGADDYITKPFSSEVLLARVRAVLRRAETTLDNLKAYTYSDGYLTIDLPTRTILLQDRPVSLSATEFDLLAYLLKNIGQTLTYQQILDQVWGWAYRDSTEYVHVYISHLRRKLEPDPREPKYLLTEHGTGYRFVSPTSSPTA